VIPLIRVLLALFVCISGAACNASYPTEPTKAAATTLFIHQGARGRVPIGTTAYGFSAYTLDADGIYEHVTDRATFTSSDSGVARLSGRSTFIAAGAGVTTISASFGGLTASVPMMVFDPRTPIYPRLSIVYNGPNAIGARAQTAAGLQRTAQSPNENVSSQVTWTSDNPRVATIDQAGIITGVGVGMTMISGTYDGLTDWYWLSIAPR